MTLILHWIESLHQTRGDSILSGSTSTSSSPSAAHGHRALFATATEWVTRLADAHRAGRLPQELARLRRYGLIIVN